MKTKVFVSEISRRLKRKLLEEGIISEINKIVTETLSKKVEEIKKKEKEERRTDNMGFRVPHQTMKEMTRLAANEHISISAWIRNRLLEAIVAEHEESEQIDREEHKKTLLANALKESKLQQKAERLKCRVCDSPAYMRFSDKAEICRSGGHTVFPNGRVRLADGTKTTLKKLRETNIITPKWHDDDIGEEELDELVEKNRHSKEKPEIIDLVKEGLLDPEPQEEEDMTEAEMDKALGFEK